MLIKIASVSDSARQFNLPILMHQQNLSVYNVPCTLAE